MPTETSKGPTSTKQKSGARKSAAKGKQKAVAKSTKKFSATQGKRKEYEVGHGKPPVHSRWKKGQSGNPAGPKPGFRTMSDAARGLLEQRVGKAKDSPTFAEAIVAEIARVALRKGNVSAAGKVNAATFVRDTAEGKPAQRVEIQGGAETRDRDRQIRFLVHTIKTTQQRLGGDVSVERIWTVIEQKEATIFGEDVTPLRDLVLAELMGEPMKQVGGGD